jgi:hypothetical protein
MSLPIYVVGIAVSLVILLTVIQMLRHGRLRERHAIWWLIAAVVVLIITIFPSTLTTVSSFLGVEVPLNLSLFLAVGVLALLALQHSSELTSLEDKVRTLTEEIALLRADFEDGKGAVAKGSATDSQPLKPARSPRSKS